MITTVSRPNDGLSSKAKSVVWWSTPKRSEETARALTAWMDSIERLTWAKRWFNLVAFRYMTGRAAVPSSYNFSSTSRPSAAKMYATARFEPPRYNVLMECSDAYANRVYKARPFLQVCPIDGDSSARFNARYLTRFMDAAFFDLDLWTTIEIMGMDCRTWGDGFIKIDVSLDGKKIEKTRLIADEVIVDDNECNAGDNPRNFGIRLFVSRDRMRSLAEAGMLGDEQQAKDAIERAPKSNNGFYFGNDIDYTDIIVLREGWHCQRGDGKNRLDKGRHVLSVGNYCFVDEPYEYETPPIARLVFKPAQTGYYSRGMPEMALGLQREVDRVMSCAWENFRRAAWPRIGIMAGSNVDPSKLGDKSNGIFNVTGGRSMMPEFIFPTAMSPDMFRYLEDTIRKIKLMFRLNDHSINGDDQKLTSGIAKTKQVEIDDMAHIDLYNHLEKCVEDIGGLIIRAAEKCKPSVTLPGRTAQLINWSDLKWEKSSYFMRAFPVGRLSQSLAVKQQQIDNWFAEGAISKQTKMRLEQVPDTDGYQTLVNASPDFVDMQLDMMIEHNRYEPPEPWIDFELAMSMAQSRYMYEKTLKTPQDRMDKILMYISALDEMKAGVASVQGPSDVTGALPGQGPGGGAANAMGNPPPAPGGFGIVPPPGAGPAPAPFPIAPGMAAPAAP